MRRAGAPYAVGDRLWLLHSDAEGATVYGPVPVLRVVALNDGRFRVECERTAGGAVHVVVDAAGRDRHDYVEPPACRPAG